MGALRSSNNGGCVSASLLDLTKFVCGIALYVVSGRELRFDIWYCDCDRSDCGCEDYGRKAPKMHVFVQRSSCQNFNSKYPCRTTSNSDLPRYRSCKKTGEANISVGKYLQQAVTTVLRIKILQAKPSL